MSILNSREHELVALGASLASNCVPCIEYHLKAAREAGLTDAEIAAAIKLADKVRRVPAEKVLEVATQLLTATPVNETNADLGCGCMATSAAKPCCA